MRTTSLSFLTLLLFLSSPLWADFDFKKTGSDVGETADFKDKKADERLDIYVMGDSITAGEMAYNTSVVMLDRMKNRNQHGWSLDLKPSTDRDKKLTSLFERLGSSYPERMTNAAWSGAYVDKATKLNRSMANFMGNIQNFTQQITRLKRLKETPNLILLAPFHNNLDYDYDMKTIAELKGSDEAAYLKAIPLAIAEEYKKELQALVPIYKAADKKVSIVIMGNLNLKMGLATRDEAKKLHEAQPKEKFPFYDVANERFASTLPEHREKLIALAEEVNAQLKKTVTTLNEEVKKLGLSDKIQFRYSPGMTDANLNKVEDLHADDAFHPSEIGHNKIAESMEKDLLGSLDFLGVKRR